MFHPDLDRPIVTSCPSLNQRIVIVKLISAMISEASPSVQFYPKFLNTVLLINLKPFSLLLTASLDLRKDVDVGLVLLFGRLDWLLTT